MHKLSGEQLAKLKSEFAKNKMFVVSQVMPGSSKSNGSDYRTQLELFPELKHVVHGMTLVIENEQSRFVETADNLGIRTETLRIPKEQDGELAASITELALEGLRSLEPPLLDRRGDQYSPA
jgi:hypothetical protein